MRAEDFYRERDSRSASYLRSDDLSPAPLRIVWGGEAARSVAGQVLLASLINQCARFARRISLFGPDAPMQAPCLVQREALHDSLIDTARAIDPFGVFDYAMEKHVFTIAVGRDAGAGDIYVGSSGWGAVASQDRSDIPPFDNCPIGAAMASCIATSHGFNASLHLANPAHTGPFSARTWTADGDFAPQFPSPASLDLGLALIVGAGAVAAAFAYWCNTLKLRAAWDIVDKDLVDLSNTNRGMLFIAEHAGLHGQQARKADVLADWLGNATPYDVWYHEFIKTPQGERRWDVIFPLANNYNARGKIQSQYPALMLHATTGEHWETYLHRHRPGTDGCISCRFPSDLPTPNCATGEVERANGDATDAALPYMSAAAGLMLAVDCLRLISGQLSEENFFILDWSSALNVRALVQTCASACVRWGEPSIRNSLNRHTRWFAKI